jgi:single-strand DNA-binding protein
MSDLNVFTTTGRLGRDPEARYFESGSLVVNFTIAINGRRDDPPFWINCTIWGKLGQVAADYLKKGSKVGLSGSLKMDTWTDRSSGEERQKLVLNVNNLVLLDSRGSGGSGENSGGGQSWKGEPSDEEVPF